MRARQDLTITGTPTGVQSTLSLHSQGSQASLFLWTLHFANEEAEAKSTSRTFLTSHSALLHQLPPCLQPSCYTARLRVCLSWCSGGPPKRYVQILTPGI